MSEFHVEVVRIGPLEKHPNADTLSITHVYGGYPVIVRTSDFAEGDLAVYVPVDSLVPVNNPRFAFLADEKRSPNVRVRAKRLRGVFSMGLLVHADTSMIEHANVADVLKITRYDPPEPMQMGGENEHDPGYMPHYTDIEPLRKYGHEVFVPGEEVIVTEKIHGCNARFCFRDGRLWVGSHTGIKKYDPANLWWKVALNESLEARLAKIEPYAIYGEIYGQVQDLHYDAAGKLRLTVFDVLDTITREYLDYNHHETCTSIGLSLVPLLYRGPFDYDTIAALAEGRSTIPGANNVREGIVVRPVTERQHNSVGRVIFKMHGEGYHMRKNN